MPRELKYMFIIFSQDLFKHNKNIYGVNILWFGFGDT